MGNENIGGNKIKAICIGLAASFLGMLLLSLLLSLIVYISPLSDLHLDKLAVLIEGVALLLGGFIVGMYAREKGLVLGLITALLVSLLLFLLNGGSGLLGIKIIVSLLAGGIGGILGVH